MNSKKKNVYKAIMQSTTLLAFVVLSLFQVTVAKRKSFNINNNKNHRREAMLNSLFTLH